MKGESGPERIRLAPAKVNLALHVTARRPDGYHELDTLVVFGDEGDRLAVEADDRLSIVVTGPFAGHVPAGPDNLVLRAAEALAAAAGRQPGAAIRLEKRLPAGAGFGGGSADAAATLLALNDLWGLDFPPSRLAEIGREIGADVPMCLHGRGLRAGGIGERIEPVEGLPPLPLVLVWPDRPVATGPVFQRLPQEERGGLPDLPKRAGSPSDVSSWLIATRNDLERPALAIEPAIGDALGLLRADGACLLARMSGSGSGCFGLYAGQSDARAAAERIGSARPGWWVAPMLAR
ncbi:4-(cytidine 5'-diphospho)-2-C-methyl-D-erythritol kinase [Faunimonas sp. B44]|uniref:4-(cytidine 5'-diphospho)-2-C-methyl-D-erythritol kinase n=1 Tax=Faunimonas sp. B44 TaxID=3461493 RepID=UPI004043DCBC